MTTPNELRLLPWSGPGDKPCYLSTDDPDGYMSRLADGIQIHRFPQACQVIRLGIERLSLQRAL